MSRNEAIWIIDDDASIRWVLERALQQAQLRTRSFADAQQALAALGRERPVAVITDIRMPGMNGLDFMERLKNALPEVPVIVTTAHSDLDSAVSAYEGGAFEYLPKPFDVNEAVSLARRALRQYERSRAERREAPARGLPEIVGEAPAMQEVFRAIGRLSQSHITVLITGESGTGKELVARALHRHSPRAGGPFIAVNTAAIPRELLESEFFGHEKGAFTGAQALRRGRFEQADGGTLFLDEIGDMPLELQTRLLRVLADGEFYRVGGHAPIRVNVRIIAATHQDLEARVARGEFREDLYHRLNVIRIHVPALRERREDIPLLLHHFLARAAEELDTEVKTLHPEVEALLTRLPWPGNVRQLENLCRWLTVMASGHEVQLGDLPPELLQGRAENKEGDGDWAAALARWADAALARGGPPLLEEALPRFERTLIERALARTGGRKQDAARLLGWGRNTLTRKLKELGFKDSEDAPA